MRYSDRQQGWTLFLAALALMLSLVAVDIAKIGNWYEATSPEFVASFLMHIAAVITAFLGGKLIPHKETQNEVD